MVSEEGVYSELHPVFVEQQARVEVVPGIHHQLEVEVEAEPTLDLPVALVELSALFHHHPELEEVAGI